MDVFEYQNSLYKRKSVNADQESWVKARIKTAIKMGIKLHQEKLVGADEPLFQSGIDGIVNGAAVEIIDTLNMNNIYVNLRPIYK